jgi:hypothetical protein
MNRDNSQERTLADYAWLSGILLLVFLMCFSIILLANGAKQRARILGPTASTASSSSTFGESGRSDFIPTLTPSESLSKAPAPLAMPDQTGDEAQKLALPGMEKAETTRENPGHFAGVREVTLRKSRPNHYRRSGSHGSKRVKTLLIALWHRYL